MTVAPRDWLALADVAQRTGLAADVARSVLVRLRGCGLVKDDGAQRFARTDGAEPLLKRSGA